MTVLSASVWVSKCFPFGLGESHALLFLNFITALLVEAERLAQERMDIQRQAEKDQGGLAARLRLLELALEEQESSVQQQEEQHRAQTEDLQQHIAALEKQLKHHRQFIDVCLRMCMPL